MKIKISTQDITPYMIACTWSGARGEAARKLAFSFLADEKIKIDNGYTVYAYDDEQNLIFQGNIYNVAYNRKKRTVSVTAFDHLWVLNRSKATRKFKDALPENIAKEICTQMGVKTGEIKTTGTPVSFIANHETGYAIIVKAYKEAEKKAGDKYQLIMNGDKLDIVKKGTLIEGFTADASKNMLQSVYKESIEELVNQVLIVDEEGNTQNTIKDAESIKKYSMFQEVYKEDPNKDSKEESKNLLTKPSRQGSITVLGDLRVKSGYSIIIKDKLFKGQFWIKNDVHTFTDGKHEMTLELEFENGTT